MLEASPAHLATRMAGKEAAVAFTVGYDEAVMNDDDAANAPVRSSALIYSKHKGSWIGRVISAPGLIVAGFQSTNKDTVFWSEVTEEGAGPEFEGMMLAGGNASQVTCTNLGAPPLIGGRTYQDTKFDVVEFGRRGMAASLIGEFTSDDPGKYPRRRYQFSSLDGGKTWGKPRLVSLTAHVLNAYLPIKSTDQAVEAELRSKLVVIPLVVPR